jgi:hypothetical protein
MSKPRKQVSGDAICYDMLPLAGIIPPEPRSKTFKTRLVVACLHKAATPPTRRGSARAGDTNPMMCHRSIQTDLGNEAYIT